jgi:capsular exopolysaccharide synthesis family protein
MVPAIRSSFAEVEETAERGEIRRLILPNYRQNPLLVNGADGSQLPAVEAYKSLRTQIIKRHLDADLHSVVVTSAARADGKTVTTFNLASSCAQLEDVPVLLVDADLRSQGLTKLMGNVSGSGLADFLSGTAKCEDIATKTNLGDLWVVGAGKDNHAPAELFSNGKWLQFVIWARKNFKLVLFDSPPISAVTDFDLISSACDGILLVVRALKTPREDLQESLRQLDTKKVVGVVWNGTHKPANYYR